MPWLDSCIKGCTYSVSVGSACSSKWSSKYGTGQERRFSSFHFNVECITIPLRDLIATHGIFANDSCFVFSCDDSEHLSEKIRSVVKPRKEWYRWAGFCINGEKSGLIGFGCSSSPVLVDGFYCNLKGHEVPRHKNFCRVCWERLTLWLWDGIQFAMHRLELKVDWFQSRIEVCYSL